MIRLGLFLKMNPRQGRTHESPVLFHMTEDSADDLVLFALVVHVARIRIIRAADGDNAAVPGHPDHLVDGFLRIAAVAQHPTRERYVERAVFVGQCVHVAEIDPGVQLYVDLEAIGEADAKGMRTVMTTLNGQLRPVYVRDRSISVETRQAERADTSRPGRPTSATTTAVSVKHTQYVG